MSRDVLQLLGLRPSEESRDYVSTKRQFHLFTLLTEQRHERTMQLGAVAARDAVAGLRQLLDVDADIVGLCEDLARSPAVLEQMALAVCTALEEGRRLYFYGCGATGRLAKLMESSFWLPFWRRAFASPHAAALRSLLPCSPVGQLVGEMTGGDRALVASLEGFEDLQLLGALQLSDHGIERGDVVFCVTEGGETSSVIGTILAARGLWADAEAARERLFFVYNNPDEVLRPFERSVRVLDDAGITKLCLATGAQALAGSTRMQATSSETWVLGVVLEHGLDLFLRPRIGDAAAVDLGFGEERALEERVRDFAEIQQATASAADELAALTEAESRVYRQGGRARYCAGRALVTVFTDCTERSPTFRLHPLDAVDATERRSWVSVCTHGESAQAAWHGILGRPFRGLAPGHYADPLQDRVEDPYLRRAALSSLANAGDDQEERYDFSWGGAEAAKASDLAVLVTVSEEARAARDESSLEWRFLNAASMAGAERFHLHVGLDSESVACVEGAGLGVSLPFECDPLELRRHVALKLLLNAHSTCTMARLGRVVGNTMTNVSPSNLKLVGRATHLIESHVREYCERHGLGPVPGFAECNAVLYDAMAWAGENDPGRTAEVGLSVVRILEALRRQGEVAWDEAAAILSEHGLAAHLAE